MYTPKVLVSGYQIGLKNKNLYVAVPDTYWEDGRVEVRYGNTVKEFKREDIAYEHYFYHKYQAGKYKLNYVLWERRKKGSLSSRKYV